MLSSASLLRIVAALSATMITASGCKAEIDGYWQGRVGADTACLSLEQTGSSIKGEVCVNGACDDIAHGQVVEDELTLHYGCNGCAFVAPTRLDVAVLGGTLEGYAHLTECECTVEQCDCVLEAEFSEAASCP
jgi:hypothetical protein